MKMIRRICSTMWLYSSFMSYSTALVLHCFFYGEAVISYSEVKTTGMGEEVLSSLISVKVNTLIQENCRREPGREKKN